MSESALTQEEILRWTRVGMLSAFAMLLSYLETFIPIPIPGVKLGLANIAVLVILGLGDAKGAVCVAVIKVLAAGLLFGNPLTMAYSAVGTAFSLVGMVSLSKLKTMRIEVVSIVGALLHETGQLLVASALLGTFLVWHGAPVFLMAGCITGLLCGIVSAHIVERIKQKPIVFAVGNSLDGPLSEKPYLKSEEYLRTTILPSQNLDDTLGLFPKSTSRRTQHREVKRPHVVLVTFLVFSVVVLHATGAGLAICAILTVAVCVVARVSLKVVMVALKPLMFILILTSVMQILTHQNATVMFNLGVVSITSEALNIIAVMMIRVMCVMGASLAFMCVLSMEQLVESARWLLTPLRKAGVKTEGFVLALDTAMQFVPLMASHMKDSFAQTKPKMFSKSFWNETLPNLIVTCMRDCAVLASDLSKES